MYTNTLFFSNISVNFWIHWLFLYVLCLRDYWKDWMEITIHPWNKCRLKSFNCPDHTAWHILSVQLWKGAKIVNYSMENYTFTVSALICITKTWIIQVVYNQACPTRGLRTTCSPTQLAGTLQGCFLDTTFQKYNFSRLYMLWAHWTDQWENTDFHHCGGWAVWFCPSVSGSVALSHRNVNQFT